MFKQAIGTIVLVGVLAGTAMADDTEQLTQQGKAVIMEFSAALKDELTKAMKSEGPVHAIAVCNVKAPEIAARVSGSSGWTVARSSHKLRNPGNAPDAYTAAVIDAFLARQASGTGAADLAKAEIVEEGGAKYFRLVTAIPTGQVCLNCHGGAEVKPDVEAKLVELYPQDQARGFKLGEMRGVFTLVKPLD